MKRGPPSAWRARLAARFDAAVLRPPPADTPWPPASSATFAALRDWCLSGAAPRMTQPLAVASLAGPAAAARQLALQLALERDGSLRMRALGAWGRVALRLQTKARDLQADRPLRAEDPWDAGSLRAGASGLQALDRFAPRRPTLIVGDGLDAATLQAVLGGLGARQQGWHRPVRLLLLNAPPALQADAWPRFTLDAVAV